MVDANTILELLRDAELLAAAHTLRLMEIDPRLLLALIDEIERLRAAATIQR